LIPKLLDCIPQSDVRTAIEEYKSSQGRVDYSKASFVTEFEDFSKMVSTISSELVSSMNIK
jgi:hypothetical protein